MRSERSRKLQGIEPLEDRRLMAIGVSLVADLNAGPADSDPRSGANLNGTLFFTGRDESGVREIWKLNNTTGGVAHLTDLPDDKNNSYPLYLVNTDGKLFFDEAAASGDIFARLWKSDGTAAGTMLVSQAPKDHVNSLVTFNGGVLYCHPVLGEEFADPEELWFSDGGSGTMKLATIDDAPNLYTNVAGTMFLYG
jgi:ELWxxDGT repeat protein